MRRLVVVTVLALVGGFFPAAPALATDEETIYYTTPSGWGERSGACVPPGDPGNAFTSPHYGPGDPQYGTGSLEMTAATGSVTGPVGTFNTLSALTFLGARVWETPGSTFAFTITIQTGPPYLTLVWAPAPTEGSWQTVIPDFDTTVWKIYNYETGVDTGGTTTLAAAKTTYASNNWEPGFVSWGCSAGSDVFLDAAQVTAGLVVDQFYNFEAQPTAVTMTASATTVTFGQKVTLRTHGTWLGSPVYEGAPLQLWAKPSGKAWAKIATVLADASGNAAKIVAPRVGTTYQWRFASQGSNQPSASPLKAVAVKAKVTAELLDTTVHKGQRLVVVGKVTPDKGGVRATLFRSSATGQIKLGSVLVRNDGTYRITSSVVTASGSQIWSLYVKVPDEGGNLSGKSPIFKAQIN